MREQQSDYVQGRFTAYLVVAVSNRRMRYLERKHRLIEKEVVHPDLLELGYVSFEHQYRAYISEKEALVTENWMDPERLAKLLQDPQLMYLIKRLKEKERKILFAKVFGELSFQELGAMFHKTPRQAEMAYYYILRKLRKEMEGRENEI